MPLVHHGCLRKKLDEYDGLIAANPIWRQRTEDVGIAPPDFAIRMGLSGPNLRASGIPYDLRSANGGYGAYRELGYTPVDPPDGDTAARFRVRIDEMRASLDVIEKVLDGIPAGPVISDDRKVVLPPRHELHTSMEALIHHFKLVTEGFRVPAGQVYAPIESPRGEFGFHLVVRRQRQALARPPAQPSLVCAAVAGRPVRGPLPRRHDRRPRVHRPGPGRRRPLMAAHEGTLYDRIQAEIAKYPDRRSAILGALRLAQEEYGWLKPEAIEEVARAIDLSPGTCQAVASFYDMFSSSPWART